MALSGVPPAVPDHPRRPPGPSHPALVRLVAAAVVATLGSGVAAALGPLASTAAPPSGAPPTTAGPPTPAKVAAPALPAPALPAPATAGALPSLPVSGPAPTTTTAPPIPGPPAPRAGTGTGASRAAVDIELPPTAGCQPGADLVSVVDALAPGSTVTLAPGACYSTPDPLVIQGVSDVTIAGNGARLVRTQAGPVTTTDWKPQVELFQDSDVTIDDLTVQGPRAAGGANGEPQSGVIVEACRHLTLSDVTIVDQVGDFLGLYPPGTHMTARPGLYDGDNSDVTVDGGSWSGAGFHAAVIEDAIGASFTHIAISDVNVDGFNFEWDGGVDDPQLPGPPQQQVTIADDTFSDVHDVVLNVADTGAEQVGGLVFEGNRLVGHTWATFDVAVNGNDSLPVEGVTITGNTSQAPEDGPPQDGVDLAHVAGALVADNNFPYAWTTQPAGHADTSRTAVIASQSSAVDVEDNTFPGAGAPASGVTLSCGNTYSVSEWQAHTATQPACPA
ncbi:MAG TPA: hypothetical protein VKU91_06145 [Acidimicrobiales bacterium]|nr:hypothetical protein [Acidimicrobiales bacterium]